MVLRCDHRRLGLRVTFFGQHVRLRHEHQNRYNSQTTGCLHNGEV